MAPADVVNGFIMYYSVTGLLVVPVYILLDYTYSVLTLHQAITLD